jgi:predicted permease
MDIKVKAAYMLIDLVLPLAVGYFCRYQTKNGERFFRKMIEANICILYPVLSALTFWVLTLNVELIWLPILGVMLSVIPGAAAYLRVNKKYGSELDKGSYIICAMISNIGTLGGLCAFIVYGEVGFAYTQLVLLLQNVVIFMFCFPLAQYYYHKSLNRDLEKLNIASMFLNRNQLPIVGMALGLLLNLADVERPLVVGAMIDPLVHIGAWSALLPIGYSIDFGEMRKYYFGIFDLVPIKFIITPVLMYLLADWVFTDTTMRDTILILACMPTAINAVVAVKINNLNLNIAMASFVLTTAVFLLAELPALFFFLSIR